jgi:hypothetical protein
MKPKIIFIPGIFNPFHRQDKFRLEARNHGFKFIDFENIFYSYWSLDEMKNVIEEGVNLFEKYKDEPLIVICHSWGGILFNCIFQKLKSHNIRKLFFFSSPLQMEIGGVKTRKEALGYKKSLRYHVETVSYGGYFDLTVPFVWTKYRNEKHIDNLGGHNYYFHSKKFMKEFFDNL